MKKLTLPLLLCLLCLFLASCGNSPADVKESVSPSAAGSVDGEQISSEELSYFISLTRAQTITAFEEQYSLSAAELFNRTFDGKTLDGIIAENAFSAAAEAKIKLIMLRENGVYGGVSYSYFRQLMQEYNSTHSKSDSQPGLSGIPEDGFYGYYLSLGEIELSKIYGDSLGGEIEKRLSSARIEYYGEN